MATRNLSPALLSRIDRLSGCRGRWIVDCRAIDGDYSYALRSLSESWPFDGADGHRYWHSSIPSDYPHKLGSVEDAAAYCAASGWQCRLLWHSDFLDADCLWPGGYSAPSISRSNARVFRDEFAAELENADADGPGLSLDVRYISADMLETLEALENYPLIDEGDHSSLEIELQDEAWQDWAESDWRKAIGEALQPYAPEDADSYWGEELADRLTDAQVFDSFRQACDDTNTYWEEEQGDQWIDLDRVAGGLDRETLAELTGLPLLPPDQQWRREPYPWLGADPAPLVAALPATP